MVDSISAVLGGNSNFSWVRSTAERRAPGEFGEFGDAEPLSSRSTEAGRPTLLRTAERGDMAAAWAALFGLGPGQTGNFSFEALSPYVSLLLAFAKYLNRKILETFVKIL